MKHTPGDLIIFAWRRSCVEMGGWMIPGEDGLKGCVCGLDEDDDADLKGS